MKRGYGKLCICLLIVLLFAFMLPQTLASMSLSGPASAKYNIGDKVSITGAVSVKDALSGYLTIGLVCNSIVYSFQSVPISLAANEQRQLTGISAVLSESMLGICYVKTDLISNGLVLESATSKTFEVSSELIGDFKIQNTKVQKGDNVQVTGTVKRLDYSPVDGSAEIYFVQGATRYLMDVVKVSNGVLSFNQIISSISTGAYNIDILVRDIYGNKMNFNQVASFEVVSNLDVTASLSKDSAKPSEKLKIEGSAKMLDGEAVAQGIASITIDSQRYSASVSAGKYSYTFDIPNNMGSGQHSVFVEVEDSNGNRGSAQAQFTLLPVATTLQANANPALAYPSEQVIISVSLLDQAGAVMAGDIATELKNPDNDLIASKTIASGEQFAYNLEQYAVPGDWKIKSNFEKLKSEAKFTVPELKELSIILQNTSLVIINIGNIKYKDTLYIYMTSETANYTIKKTKNIDISGQMVVELSEEVPSGIYDVKIPLEDGIVLFEDVIIEHGTLRLNLTWLYAIIVLIAALGIAYIIYKRKKSRAKIKKRHKPTEQKLAKKAMERLKVIGSESKAKTHEVGSLEDFKQRTLAEIKKTEEATRNKQDKSGGAFGMFD